MSGDPAYTSAVLNARLHDAGGRLWCCPASGSCLVEAWARGYLTGRRLPYPVEAVLQRIRETEHDSDR